MIRKIFLTFAIVGSILFQNLQAGEGMYPLSELKKLDFAKLGFEISGDEIYNPDGVSLVDALVKVNGCTGSFVSPQGLILTNHHCAFAAIKNASTLENNYLENGFYAETRAEEYPAKGYTCRITESYEDVSDKVLVALEGISDYAERTKALKKIMNELAEEACDAENSVVAEVSEMFKGKTYVLFKYRVIKDVRLVYAPPRAIGEFGGESDNWIWPRHSGDFAFMRAYVAPDGSSAEYSEENVPYSPKKFLKINSNGVRENDFVFILGYPGRTYRNRPAAFIEFMQYYQMPFIQKLYEWMIEKFIALGDDNPELRLKFATIVKRLSNTEKNYRGKMLGLRRTQLIGKRRAEEKEIVRFIAGDSTLAAKYGNLIGEIDSAFAQIDSAAFLNLWLYGAFGFSPTLSAAGFLLDYEAETAKDPSERDPAFSDGKIGKTLSRVNYVLALYNSEFERDYLLHLFELARKYNLDVLKNFDEKSFEKFIDEVIARSEIGKRKINADEIETEIAALKKDGELYEFVRSLYDLKKKMKRKSDAVQGKLNELYAKWIDVKSAWKGEEFIPDANSTLRLTYGRIKGYSPADAVWYSPITTLRGIVEKSALGGDYELPERIAEVISFEDYGSFFDADLDSVPVDILYDTDTTGGNSGSPVLNAKGELVGLNFDRAFEATINDFAWDESYSRSIGVDIRYVLWTLGKISGAENLLNEMGAKND